MKEVIIQTAPKLNKEEQRLTDLHSLFNILNVLGGELTIVELMLPGRTAELLPLSDEIRAITHVLRHAENVVPHLGRLRASGVMVIGKISEIQSETAPGEVRDELTDSLANLKSIYKIMGKRLQEIRTRVKNTDLWVYLTADVFRQQFEDVFCAIEKNAKGRYRIFFNLARQSESDYYIDLKVESELAGGALWVPAQLTDVLRDLTANARKYTDPGGKVALALYQSATEIRCVVEDSGYGIPEEELERVVEFGYRASNVADRPTMGGGFGLTKAACLVADWQGQLCIASALGEGTRIHIAFPSRSMETREDWAI